MRWVEWSLSMVQFQGGHAKHENLGAGQELFRTKSGREMARALVSEVDMLEKYHSFVALNPNMRVPAEGWGGNVAPSMCCGGGVVCGETNFPK